MKCTIYSANGRDDIPDISSVTLPGIDGEMEILTGHTESFIRLNQGKIIFKTKNGLVEKNIVANTICYVSNNNISVIL